MSSAACLFPSSRRKLATSLAGLFLILMPVLAGAAVDSVAPIETAAATLVNELRARSARKLLLQISQAAEGYRLHEVHLRADGAPPLRLRFNAAQAAALQGGAEALLPLPWAVPPARLQLTLIARREDAAPGTPRWIADAEIAATLRAHGGVQIGMVAPSLPGLAPVLQHAAPGASDPQRQAAFARASQRPLEAAVLGAPPEPFRADPVIDQYNAAVAQLAAGAVAEADAALDRLGSLDARDPLHWAIRDRANRVLGEQRLARGAGVEARAAFLRVRSPGPDSTAALLGLGWTFLVGDAAAAVSLEDQAALWGRDADHTAALRRGRPFRYLHSVAVAGARAEDVRRALVPWTELLGRDPADPAVQQGLLAVPYALAHLGAHEQGRRYWLRAQAALEEGRARQQAALQWIAEGAFRSALVGAWGRPDDGWQHSLAALPTEESATLLPYLLQDERLLPVLAELRRLQAVAQTLGEEAERAAPLDPALQARLQALQQAAQAAQQARWHTAEDLARTRLQHALGQTEAALAEAHFALARIDDRPLAGEEG